MTRIVDAAFTTDGKLVAITDAGAVMMQVQASDIEQQHIPHSRRVQTVFKTLDPPPCTPVRVLVGPLDRVAVIGSDGCMYARVPVRNERLFEVFVWSKVEIPN